MPIASGAAGRVDVGVHTGTASHGLKTKAKFTNRNCDSYLQRYQELKQKKKSHLLQGDTDPAEISDQEIDGAEDGHPHSTEDSEEKTSGKTSGEERPKKSQLCILL